ncbi:MAG: hypothetical protein ACO3FI_07270 [Cyclobacteriaceae bacterium]
METRKSHRRLITVAGLIASLVIILAGGFRGQLITIKGQPSAQCLKECSKSECEHKDSSKTYVSAPSEAIPGSTAGTVFECPVCGDSGPETSVPSEEKKNSVISFVNNYFKTLVRSLIRANAP